MKFRLLSILLLLNFQFLSLSSQTIQKDTSYTVYQTLIKLKKKYLEIKPILAVADKNLIFYEQLVYKKMLGNNLERELHLDIFRPNNQIIYPALIMIHGGGWRSGDKSMEKPMAQQIALKGYVTIPVEYRLSLEAKYPAGVHDIKASIRWIKDNARKYGIDITKIAIEGESAGGQLAMLVAMTNNLAHFEGDKNGSKSSSVVQAAIDVDGVVDFLAPNSLNIQSNPNSADVFWLGGTFEEKPLLWKEASSIYWVSSKSVPTLFITSAMPRFHAGRDEMIDLFNQNGIYSESYSIPDSPHSFWLLEPWAESTKEYMLKFLKKVLN